MNFNDWQAQQKALKDQEKTSKKNAAEALNNYRGGATLSEEETKLKVFREQDRKNKIEAEEQLRNYRSQLDEADAKKAAEREEEIRRKKEEEEKLRALGIGSNSQNDGNVFIEGAVNQAVEKFSDSFVLENGTSQTTTTNISPSTSEQPPSTEEQRRVDKNVLFKFGLISDEEVPSLDGYITAINREFVETQSNPSVQLGYPIVTQNEIDDNFQDPAGRDNVKRRIVTVAVPLSASDAEKFTTARTQIVESLRFAIQNDSLKKVEQQ